MMVKPDKYFYDFVQPDIEPKFLLKARKSFRRAIRDYYCMQRKYVYEPETGERVQSVRQGMYIEQQQNQRRKIEVIFNGGKVGRPQKIEIQILVSRLFLLWGRYAKTPPTFSWKTNTTVETDFECMLLDLLPKLGAKDVRGHVEKHWRARGRR